jgi:formamidopyrimidine-DNA glycosylase
MPELPDLQVFSKNLTKKLAGKKLEKITVAKGFKLNVSGAALKKKLEGETLESVSRQGKELWFLFSKNQVLATHLMLQGELHWLQNEKEAPKYILLELFFEKDIHLALTDPRKMAKGTLNPPGPEAPDALSKEIDLEFWKKTLQSKAAIKKLLMDQQVIRGIGNAYADEILWDARISPFSIANKIPEDKIKALAKSVKTVLTDAEKKINKAKPGLIGGEFRDFLLIHNSHKKSSPDGAAIKQKTLGGRKTYYTEDQQLFN